MIPYAIFAHTWPEAGGDFFNVVDPDNLTKLNGSTVSVRTCQDNGIHMIKNAADSDSMIRMVNLAIAQLSGI